MQHPYQLIATVVVTENVSAAEFVLAAIGPTLVTASIKEGSIASEWSAQTAELVTDNGKTNNDGVERPAKKQKTTNAAATAPNIIKLVVANREPLVAVVTEDKHLHVLSVDINGKLQSSSRRCMPKRPCAIQILPDDETIICGDKFGDVYSLPVSANPEDKTKPTESGQGEQEITQAPKDFQPSASELTVHTKRNLKALEAQRKQKNVTPRKEPLAVEHKLLLGHVSMLTDMVFVNQPGAPQNRGRIITADRDEHIRVSRPIPQSHIIEGFCLGHEDFVSRLCPISNTNLIVCGGGDDWLGVWNWEKCTLVHKLDVKSVLKEADGRLFANKSNNIAVSGLWQVSAPSESPCTIVLAACEKVPALCAFVSDSWQRNRPLARATTFDQVPLDVTSVGDHIFITFDSRDQNQDKILSYKPHIETDGTVILNPDLEGQKILRQLNELPSPETEGEKLDNLLYGVANLRKRGGWEESTEETG